MRFLQIHTFYNQYLVEYNRRYPEMADAPFDEQIRELLKDGFSGCHMFAPHMDHIGYEGKLVIANYPMAQTQWLRENGFPLADQNNWIQEIATRQVDTLQPDILYLSDCCTFDSRFVRSLHRRPSLVVGFRGAHFAHDTDLSEFDVLLSNSTLILQQAKERGARSVDWFFPGMPRFLVDAVRNEPKNSDITFTGSWSDMHCLRNQYLSRLCDAAALTNAFVPTLFLNRFSLAEIPESITRYAQPAVWGLDMYRELRRARIVFNAEIDFGGYEAGNMRLFEATSVGSFVLTQHHDNMKDYFEPGREVETFRNENELIEKTHYYLNNPQEREIIAQRGQTRSLREYSLEQRITELYHIIKKHFLPKASLKDTKMTLPPSSEVGGSTIHYKELVSQALAYLEAGMLEEAKNSLQHVFIDDTELLLSRSVAELKIEAERLIDAADYQEAFTVLIDAKALKEPLKGLDYLRALCFLKLNQGGSALEALKEELRYFPENSEAEALLKLVQAQVVPQTIAVSDGDFKELMELIRPYTMLSEHRLYSLYKLSRNVCEHNIPGNFVECGVAAGGSSALLAYVIKKYSRLPRRLFSFDSFSGMPNPTALDSHQGIDAESTGWGTGTCSAPEASVMEICSALGVADVVTPVKGYFEETLPKMRDWVGMVALLHLDGDWYQSTKSILENLYDRLVNGAFLQVDDYGYWDGCRRALHEFEEARNIKFAISHIDGTGVWFEKPDCFPVNTALPLNLIEEFKEDDPAPKGVISQMSANERFQLYYTVRRLLPAKQAPLRFIEIGSYSGASLLLTYQALSRLVTNFQGISVEPGGTSQFYDVVRLLGRDVLHFSLFSHDAAKKLEMMLDPEHLPEFIFVDGDHTYDGVKQDILDYYPLLAPGGIMMFHDYLPALDDNNRAAIFYHHANAEPGIRQACKEVMEQQFGCIPLELPLLNPTDPTQTQPQLPIIPGVFSSIRAYRKPESVTY